MGSGLVGVRIDVEGGGRGKGGEGGEFYPSEKLSGAVEFYITEAAISNKKRKEKKVVGFAFELRLLLLEQS